MSSKDVVAETEAELARSADHAWKAVKPYLGILAAVIVLAAMFLGFKAFSDSKRNARYGDAWREIDKAKSDDDFEAIAKNYADTPAANFAKMQAARGKLGSALDLLPKGGADARDARERLAQLEETFKSLADEPNVDPAIRAEAAFAQALSAEARGAVKEAISLFQNVVLKHKLTTFGQLAERRVKELQDKDAEDFYAKLAKFEAKPKPDLFTDPKNPPDLPKPITPEQPAGTAPDTKKLDGKEEPKPMLKLVEPEKKDAKAADAKAEPKKAPETKPADKKEEASKPTEKKDEIKPADKKDETKPAGKSAESKPADAKAGETKPATKKN